jgi:hypothetical protein
MENLAVYAISLSTTNQNMKSTYLVGSDDTEFNRTSMFGRNVLPPSSQSKSKP